MLTRPRRAQLAQAVTGSNAEHIFYDQARPARTHAAAHLLASDCRRSPSRAAPLQLFVKEPGCGTVTPWHTDHSYWQLAGGSVCTLWLALDVVPGSTVVGYAAGSHKWGLKHQIKSFSGDAGRYAASAAFPPPPDIDALEAKGEVQVLRWDVQPGDVLIFDSYVVHGSPGNASNSVRRRAYATHWANDGARFDARPGTMHARWAELGFDARLAHGAPVACDLHPAIPTKL